VTVSDTRTTEDDTGGDEARRLCTAAGHPIAGSRIVKDEPGQITALLEELVAGRLAECVILTGGTGISRRDRTYETVAALLERRLDGFGELFRVLSYQEIGSAAMLSRAVGGLMGNLVVFALPGSPAAVRLGLEKLVLPELPHVVSELRR
jgi:molybdenum cofactor biosynthesis protein B